MTAESLVLREETGLGDGGDLTDGRARSAGMDRDRQAELAGGLDFRLVDLRRNGSGGIVAAHAAPREAEGDQAIAGIFRPVALEPLQIGQ